MRLAAVRCAGGTPDTRYKAMVYYHILSVLLILTAASGGVLNPTANKNEMKKTIRFYES